MAIKSAMMSIGFYPKSWHLCGPGPARKYPGATLEVEYTSNYKYPSRSDFK